MVLGEQRARSTASPPPPRVPIRGGLAAGCCRRRLGGNQPRGRQWKLSGRSHLVSLEASKGKTGLRWGSERRRQAGGGGRGGGSFALHGREQGGSATGWRREVQAERQPELEPVSRSVPRAAGGSDSSAQPARTTSTRPDTGLSRSAAPRPSGSLPASHPSSESSV